MHTTLNVLYLMLCRWAWCDNWRVSWRCRCYVHSSQTIPRFCIWIIFQAKDMQETIAWDWEMAAGHTIIVWNWWRSAMCCAVKLWSAVGITHTFYLGHFQLIMLLSEPPYQRLRNTWDWMHNSSTHWPTLYFLLSTLRRWSHMFVSCSGLPVTP